MMYFFFFSKFFYLFIYFLASLGLHCCTGFSLVVASGSDPLVGVHRFLFALASHCRAWARAIELQWLWLLDSRAQDQNLSCSKACGIFPDGRLNPCLLALQTDSFPLSHLGSPV